MAEGRSRDEWTRTASMMALIANVNRDPNKAAFLPSDFLPEGMKDKSPPPKVGIDALKVFVPGVSV